MNKQEAISVLANVMGTVRATPQEHQVIGQALQYLNTLEEPKPKETKSKEDK